MKYSSCKEQKYDVDLKTSIVIIYHNECLSVLLRMIEGIFRKTSEKLLHEVDQITVDQQNILQIILYDDLSDKDLIIGDHLKNYSKIVGWPQEKLVFHRSEARQGLIRAKVDQKCYYRSKILGVRLSPGHGRCAGFPGQSLRGQRAMAGAPAAADSGEWEDVSIMGTGDSSFKRSILANEFAKIAVWLRPHRAQNIFWSTVIWSTSWSSFSDALRKIPSIMRNRTCRVCSRIRFRKLLYHLLVDASFLWACGRQPGRIIAILKRMGILRALGFRIFVSELIRRLQCLFKACSVFARANSEAPMLLAVSSAVRMGKLLQIVIRSMWDGEFEIVTFAVQR